MSTQESGLEPLSLEKLTLEQARLNRESDYRPDIHFTPPFGWMNDPNGLVFLNGQYHLFYQYYPAGNTWGPMHWGHASSEDLLNWTHYPIALAPDELGMCFSGTATVDAKNRSQLFNHSFSNNSINSNNKNNNSNDDNQSGLLAFYTIAKADETHPENLRQSQGLAFSHDEGLTWQRYEHNPVLANPGIDDFRDPKVFWHEESNQWIMIVTSGQQVDFYRSPNAVDWQFSSRFGSEDGVLHGKHDERAWECPDLFPLTVCSNSENHTLSGTSSAAISETLWVLIVGVQRETYSGGSGTQYFVGHFDGERFINIHSPETVRWLDYGRDFYACQTWADVPNAVATRTGIAWMSNWLYANQVPTYRWRSMMSIPRNLTLHRDANQHNEYYLQQSFAPKALSDLSQKTLTTKNLNSKQTIDWHSPILVNLEIDLAAVAVGSVAIGSIDVNTAAISNNRVKLMPSEDLYFEFYQHDNELMLRCVRDNQIGISEFDQHFPHDFEVNLGSVRPINGQLLLDKGAVELLLENGKYSISNLIFPKNGAAQQLIWQLCS